MRPVRIGSVTFDLDALRSVQHQGYGAARYHGFDAYRLGLDGGVYVDVQMKSATADILMEAWCESPILEYEGI